MPTRKPKVLSVSNFAHLLLFLKSHHSCKGVKLFVFFFRIPRGRIFIFISSKRAILKSDLLQDREILVFAGVYMCALFSPDILQAGAVEGLLLSVWIPVFLHCLVWQSAKRLEPFEKPAGTGN